MWKIVLAGTTAIAIAGASLAYAEQGPKATDHVERWRPNAGDIAAFADARIAALHAGLKLSSDQEKNWPAVESALHDLAKQRSERIAAFAGGKRPADPIERLSLRAKTMQDRGAALGKLATAAGPLYQSLDQDQKHRFVVLAQVLRPHFGQWRGHRHWRGHDGFRRGMGGNMGGGGPAEQRQPQ